MWHKYACMVGSGTLDSLVNLYIIYLPYLTKLKYMNVQLNFAQWVRLLDHTSLSPIRHGFAPGFANYKKGALDSQPQVIKFTSCLSMVGGSLILHELIWKKNWKFNWLIDWFDFWCFNANFNNISAISWPSILVVDEAAVPGKSHRPWASNW
jgi:hypothetical protein